MSLKRFDAEDLVLSSELVSSPIWTGDKEILVVTESVFNSSGSSVSVEICDFNLSETQKNGYTGTYYLDVYNQVPEEAASSGVETRVQFSITYGNKNGGGSAPYTLYETAAGSDNELQTYWASPTATIYGQYRSLCLGSEDSEFVFGYGAGDGSSVGSEDNDFFAITIDRARFKEKLRPGSLEIHLHVPTGDVGPDVQVDASGKHYRELTLVDNSEMLQSVRYIDSGRVYDLVNRVKTLEMKPDGIAKEVYSYSYGPSGSYGFLFPDIGVILINASALGLEGLNRAKGKEYVDTEATAGNTNLERFFDCIKKGGYFKLQQEETVTSNYVFVRARNSEFNYSTNPSNITGSGELKHSIMINNPQAYITTVGLYNDSNDLLAVAKLSRPLLKDFTKEALIRIKLDY